MRKFDGPSTWTATTTGTQTSTSTQATGVSGFSDFAIGEVPTFSVDDVSLTEGDGGMTNASFLVTLSAPASPFFPPSVTVGTADGTATDANNDYKTEGPALITFTGGQSSQVFLVPVFGDTKFEPDENYFVNLSGASNASIADAQGLGTILNDDTAPTVSIDDVKGDRGQRRSDAGGVHREPLQHERGPGLGRLPDQRRLRDARRQRLCFGDRHWPRSRPRACRRRSPCR